MKTRPGYETTEHLWSPNPEILKKFADKHIIPFLKESGVKEGDLCYDMGEYNPRIKYIAEQMGLQIETVDVPDFNWAFSTIASKGSSDIVFAFEIVEHLQNPLLFMDELKYNLSNSGSIYVIIPCNPRFLWHEMHFFEMDRKHFEKWILAPLGLKIVRYKKIYFIASWRAYLIGFRPLWRVLTGKTSFKDFMRSLFYVQYFICEVKNEK